MTLDGVLFTGEPSCACVRRPQLDCAYRGKLHVPSDFFIDVFVEQPALLSAPRPLLSCALQQQPRVAWQRFLEGYQSIPESTLPLAQYPHSMMCVAGGPHVILSAGRALP